MTSLHRTPYRLDDYRCTSVDQGDRCQLIQHDDDQHVACIRFEQTRGGRDFISEYRTWGAEWMKGRPGVDGLRWSPTFPGAQERAR